MLMKTGLINLDFATLRQAFQQRGGKTLFGLGEGAGENAAADAIDSLKLCPLLHTPEFSRKADRLLVNIVGGTDLTLPKVNDLMSAIAEKFGRDSHIIMGAVIDEAMQQRLEICVLGTSDVNPRSGLTRRLAASAQKRPPVGRPGTVPATETSALVQEMSTGETTTPAPGSTAKELADAAAALKLDQDEFGFGEVESRGHFEKTDRNLFDGQDLDVPTYLRKGVKIAL